MRILHTSDWHLGKTLEGRSREEEQVNFIEELLGIAKEEGINLVVIAGDVFDSVNPPASAEELYYDAIERLSDNGKRGVIVIAGNHDSPDRLCAAIPLAVRHGIILYGHPMESLRPQSLENHEISRVIEGGRGWVELQIPHINERAVIALLPYPSESRMGRVFADLAEDDRTHVKSYSDCVREYFTVASEHFRKETVNLGVSHLFISGGISSDSERPIHLGGAPEVAPSLIPAGANYAALGHLHRPQAVSGSACPARYSGSPIAYSFSESGIAKSVVIVDALPGRDAIIREIFLSSGCPLVRWRAVNGLEQVLAWIDENRDPDCWIDLEIHLKEPLKASEVKIVRESRSKIVNIRPVFTEDEKKAGESRAGLTRLELFKMFFSRQNGGAEPPQEVLSLFMSLVNEEPCEDMEVAP